jgi:uncharacterized membrane protein
MNGQHTHPLVTAGVVAGLGLGGFFDGIVLHQILQWHHMLTVSFPPTSVENLQLNTLADGLFHGATYILTVIGFFMLWRAARSPHVLWSTRVLVGAMLVGWGLFNVVEGLIDHHLLQIHHVRPGPNQLAWDLAFLGWGAVMLLGGWGLIRAGRTDAVRVETTPATSVRSR